MLFPHPPTRPSPEEIGTFGNLLKESDLITDKVTIKGTSYVVGFIVVLEVVSADVLLVGEIEKVVIRKSNVHYIASIHEAARNKFLFFESSPRHQMRIVRHVSLADYKPLFKRFRGPSFPFILHHHLPTPIWFIKNNQKHVHFWGYKCNSILSLFLNFIFCFLNTFLQFILLYWYEM